MISYGGIVLRRYISVKIKLAILFSMVYNNLKYFYYSQQSKTESERQNA